MSDTKAIQAPRGVLRFKEPVLVRHQDAVRFLWGDEASHQVYDWVYGRGDRISALIFSLRPGEYFKSSKSWKTLYNQHRFYYVLQGQLAIHDPGNGEVAVAQEGEAIYWSGLRWHFGYNFGERETLVLDWYAPPERAASIPEIVASEKKEDLAQEINGRYELLGKWPAERPSVQSTAWREGGVITIRREDCLHMILGSETPALVSLFVSSEVITTGIMDLLPGRMTDAETHRGDEVVYCTSGRLNIYLPDTYDWFELHPKDCVFLPEGVRHQYCNYSDEMAQLVFAIAPYYR
jgi:mannose-6-phosphate isomerase-like protein (cupin superfamily)